MGSAHARREAAAVGFVGCATDAAAAFFASHGLTDPEALFQVHAADLRVRFPKLRTSAVPTPGESRRR